MTNTIYIHQPEKAFSFTRLPNFLFEAPTFKPLSNEAKVLYAFILRRTELSRKNGWADDCGRIFLYFPIYEVVTLLHCGRQKAVNTLRELQYAGLVEIQKQGCGKPNRIFPKSYEAVPNTDFKKSRSGIVIIREDLITEDVLEGTPTMLQYKIHADAQSLYNTPPAYGIYICGKVFKWLKKMGGLEAMKKHNEEKAKILYDFLDQSKLFKGTVVPKDRSLMNVPFVTGDADMDAKFVKEATEAGFVNLKGHRTVGGMRASIYNAIFFTRQPLDFIIRYF